MRPNFNMGPYGKREEGGVPRLVVGIFILGSVKVEKRANK